MKVTVKVDFNTAQIMRKRGMGGDFRVQKELASIIKTKCDKYVPMSSGSGAHMKNRAVIAPDGSTITYPGPYAHYQYYGEVMAGRAPKHYTGKPLTYHGGPMRGPNWDKRMMADKHDEVVNDLKIYIGGLG